MTTHLIVYHCPACDEQHEVEGLFEAGERGYGSDLDGNRGMDLPSRLSAPDTPVGCAACGVEYSPEQQLEISHELAQSARDYDWAEARH